MRLARLLVLLVVLPRYGVEAQSAPDRSAPAPSIEGAADRYLAPLRALEVFSGVVRVARGDSVLFEKAYGAADREHGVPLTPLSRFRVASLTKPFTRALAGRIADLGLLDLDWPIARWLPGFPEAERITLRLLLDHRAGVPNVNSLRYDEEALRPHTLADLVDSLAALPLDFTPGKDERYSNGGYAVATRILELASGRPYARLLEEEILAPIGLRHTRSVGTNELVPDLARGYAPAPEAFGRTVVAPFQEMETKSGGGSLVSDVADLHQWAVAIGRAPILRPATWAELFPHPGSWAHTGRSPGYNAALVRDGDVVAVVLANTYAAGMTHDVARALVALARGREPEPPRVSGPAVAEPGVLAAAEGTYLLPADFVVPAPAVEVRERDGSLVAYLHGSPVDVLVPQGGRSFLLRSLWSMATFEEPVAGRSPAVVVRPLYRPGSWRGERASQSATARGDSAMAIGQSAADTDAIAPAVAAAVYATALRFYHTPRSRRMLWLEETDLAGTQLDTAVVRRIRAELPRLRPWMGEVHQVGARLRLSSVEPNGKEAYRLTVRYRYVSPHYQGDPIDQWFIIRRAGAGWTIASRGPVA